MLRWLIIALVLANAAFFAWSQGWLDEVVGVRAIGDREPERLLRQVQPETIRILPPNASEAAAGPGCLEAGPFAATEIAAAEGTLRSALPNVPGASWSSIKTDVPGTWIVYLGTYPNRDVLDRRKEELGRRNVPFEEVHSPAALEPGLSLGRFEGRASADKALEQFTQQGIRSAKVIEIVAPTSVYRLRVEPVDAALAAQLGALRAEALVGKPFAACAKGRT
jgi:hypothetical protein